MKLRNFLFHRVSEEQDRLWPPMSPKLFEEVIRFLTKNFFVVGLENYLDDPQQFKTTKKIAAVLFDDGYKDNLDYAAPILKKYNCPASFYVVTDCINYNLPTWTYILDHLFQQTTRLELVLDFDWLPVEKRKNHFSSTEQRRVYGAWLKPFLKKLSNTQRVSVCNEVERNFSDVTIPRDKMMNWQEVKQLFNEGFIIGSHTVTHPLLASVEDKQQLKYELEVSAGTIKEQLGFFPRTISYPIGSYDSTVMAYSKEVGYKYGLAVNQRFYDPEQDAEMAIPRVELYNESFLKTRMRISGVMHTIKRLVR
jgi:peptidoglycan/xylan/chitin deacetylase (PgdA/CDA1 family)